ncbi:cyclin B-like guanine nucleotide binding protein [Nosema bombycis CQ1]|uniref:Cyclin B-like guanine nucleotide binding protein n=1 Tax=Nosema bombycis (strain CQ1 / CVCC 102059) TaxID=578461 RepID=R0MR35_NOSB1|nr:cyclin B-like guanine nucleotide binding protein [Nosema bombycis CQ1]|eukprot:EOB15343.1 cyclin B-like guanine nucleotide binding protein [Nosema bombycis CQ1]
MNFIQGQALLRTKCISLSISFIFKMEIVNYSEMILEGDHILTDDLGQIIIFDCKKGSKDFKGIIKYWSSREEKEYLEFELKPKEDEEDKDNVYILINGIYYFISSKPSSKPIISIFFKKGRFYAKKYCDDNEVGGLKEGGSQDLNDNPKVNPTFDTFKVNTPSPCIHKPSSPSFDHSPLEVILPCPSPLLDIIILNLPSSCSLHSSFSYFCFSNFKTYFGFIFCYFLEGYNYYSILLLSEFYNPLINIDNDNIPLNIPLFPNICFMITNNNKELYLSNFINLNFNFPLDFLDKVIGSILNEERICFISKKDLLLKIMYFLKYIEPFKWSHS